MNTNTLIVLSSICSFALSVTVNMIGMGIRWGTMTSDIARMKDDLAEIKGMFTLKLKE